MPQEADIETRLVLNEALLMLSAVKEARAAMRALGIEREQDRAGKVEQHAPRIAAFREGCRAPARLGRAMQRQKNAAEQPTRARVVACIQ